MEQFHIPVLLQSACTYLNIRPGKRYIDATAGGGGHTREILVRGGHVLALDQDREAISEITACLVPPHPLGEKGPDLVLVHSNFIHLREVAEGHQWRPVSGILFDMGVSGRQLTAPGRGFSFQLPGPLDMRMDQELPHQAGELINSLPLSNLALILKKYGEIPGSFALAKKIVAHRPLITTADLAKITGKFSRRVFQAFRIAVNDELNAMSLALPQAFDLLEPGGRMVVISFHSLEDRIVKNLFRTWAAAGLCLILTPRPLTPDESEINSNPRSTSAKLRALQHN